MPAGPSCRCRPPVASLSKTRSKGLQLRIAQIAPLYERVPPKLYGGTERVVSYLTEELVRQGHDVHPVCQRGLEDLGEVGALLRYGAAA